MGLEPPPPKKKSTTKDHKGSIKGPLGGPGGRARFRKKEAFADPSHAGEIEKMIHATKTDAGAQGSPQLLGFRVFGV